VRPLVSHDMSMSVFHSRLVPLRPTKSLQHDGSTTSDAATMQHAARSTGSTAYCRRPVVAKSRAPFA
jgi:hypothetical protein